jgi:hypothetical protein
MIYTYAIIKALLSSPIIDQHHLIIHTFSAMTTHNSHVVGGVASLLASQSLGATNSDKRLRRLIVVFKIIILLFFLCFLLNFSILVHKSDK